MKKTILLAAALMAAVLTMGGAAEKRHNFADFYRQQQMQLFSAVDAELARQAQTAITDNFAAVKKADVELQTKLGGRKGNLGINLIGAFTASDSHAVGWQLRGYAAQESAKGANAGVFYRAIDDDLLYGANVFLDYENGDYDGFSRFGFGGEVRHPMMDFFANYYLPLTDEQKVNATVAAFSRQGFDAKLRVNAPNYKHLKAAIDYYNFDGERGAAKEDGFRYGMELHLLDSLRLGVFYDGGAEKFGGDVAYTYTFNRNSPSSRHSRESGNLALAAPFAPDLFAAISREYSQRIMTAAIIATRTSPPADDGIVIATTTMTITTTVSVAAMDTTITTETPTMTATRMARFHFTVRVENAQGYAIATTSYYPLTPMTLPPADADRPYALTVMRHFYREFFQITEGSGRYAHVVASDYLNTDSTLAFAENDMGPFTITVVEGSEEFVSVAATITSETTTTITAITTIATVTTFATMTVETSATMTMETGATTAMANYADMPPMNDDGKPPQRRGLPPLSQAILWQPSAIGLKQIPAHPPPEPSSFSRPQGAGIQYAAQAASINGANCQRRRGVVKGGFGGKLPKGSGLT